MKKQSLIGVAAAVLIAGLANGYGILGNKGAAGADNEPEVVLCYGEVNPEGHMLTDPVQYFADRVSELAGGRVMAGIYPSGQSEDDARRYQSMEMGALGLYRDGSMSLADSGDPMVSALMLPYVLRDRDHFRRMCGSSLGRETLNNIQDCTGMIGLAYLDEGARNFFIIDRPVSKLEDMRGLKVRVQVTSMMGDTVEALGAEVVPIAYAELYMALESGTVDGAGDPPMSYYYNKFYGIAPYYVEGRHAYTPGVILAGKITWENLKEECQGALVQATVKIQKYNRTAIEEADRKVYKALEKEKVTILEPKDLQAWIQVTEPVYRKYGGEYLDLIERIWQIRQTRIL